MRISLNVSGTTDCPVLVAQLKQLASIAEFTQIAFDPWGEQSVAQLLIAEGFSKDRLIEERPVRETVRPAPAWPRPAA